MSSRWTLQTVPVETILNLRWKVLRQGLPFEEARFPDDLKPGTQHFAAFASASPEPICCATFSLNSWRDAPAWQLRGMAVEAAYRRQGVGRDLLNFAQQSVLAATPTPWLWCNARVPALDFYKNMGWEIASDLFFIETAGPHHKMCKRVE